MRLKSELETGEGHQQVHASIFSLTFDIYIYIYNYIYIFRAKLGVFYTCIPYPDAGTACVPTYSQYIL